MHARTLRYILAGATLAFLLLLFSCLELPSHQDAVLARLPRALPEAPRIRVLVKPEAEEVRLEVKGPFQLSTGDGRIIPNRNRTLAPVSVKASGGGLALGVNELHFRSVSVTPENPGSLCLDGVPWPGAVTFRRTETPLRFSVINTLNLEEYLCGVLAAETPWRSWPEETLKAQAVASRTYALHAILVARRSGSPFDVSADQMSQVYSPAILNEPVINRAVNLTRGQILTFDGLIFPAYFHAVCGGHTEDSSRVFNEAPVPALSGTPCPFCPKGGSKYDAWSVDITTDELPRLLKPVVAKLTGRELGPVRNIEPAKTGVSKRATAVRIINALEPVELDANVFRLAVGPRKLPSTLFSVEKAGAGVLRFSGKGWGHGVGMCQFGASGMGRAGWSYTDILYWYYKGARLSILPYSAPEQHPHSPAAAPSP